MKVTSEYRRITIRYKDKSEQDDHQSIFQMLGWKIVSSRSSSQTIVPHTIFEKENDFT